MGPAFTSSQILRVSEILQQRNAGIIQWAKKTSAMQERESVAAECGVKGVYMRG